nr:hypothetical protein [Tanacetum cinerariifolium]
MDLDFTVDENLKELSGEEAWEAINSFAHGQKEWDKAFIAITKEELAILRAQIDELVGNKKVRVEMPTCIAWDKVGNPCPQSNSQVLPSFEVYTPLVTYPKEVEETIGIPIEVEPLDHTKLEDLGLNTCSHDLFPSSREFPSVDEPEPQPLPNLPFFDVNLGGKKGTNSPIN